MRCHRMGRSSPVVAGRFGNPSLTKRRGARWATGRRWLFDRALAVYCDSNGGLSTGAWLVRTMRPDPVSGKQKGRRLTMATPPLITIAISTMGARSKTLVLPAMTDGICYHVVVQDPPNDLPDEVLSRPDVTWQRQDGRGVARSRNAAFAAVQTRFAQFCDDDVALDLSGVQALAAALDVRPDCAFALGWMRENLPHTGKHAAIYALTLLNSGRVGAPEIMVEVAPFRTADIWFDEDFGLGARHGIGEEYAFVTDAMKAGLKGISVPIALGSHPNESTGDRWAEVDLLRARVALFKRVFGWRHPLIRLAFAIKHRRKLRANGQFLRFIFNQLG